MEIYLGRVYIFCWIPEESQCLYRWPSTFISKWGLVTIYPSLKELRTSTQQSPNDYFNIKLKLNSASSFIVNATTAKQVEVNYLHCDPWYTLKWV